MKALSLLALSITLCAGHAFAAAPTQSPARPAIGVAASSPQRQLKPEIIASLRALLEKQSNALKANDLNVRKLIEETQTVRLGADQVQGERQLQSLYKRLNSVMAEKEEFQLRYDFLTQLIFQIDSKWGSEPLQEFLEHQLLEMAITDASNTNPIKAWRFYSYLSIAVREIPERREDLVAFIGGYLEFSGIREPKSPALFMNTRNYTNGATSQTARPVSREQLGEIVEQKMKEIEAPADIELRARAITPDNKQNP